MSFPTLDQRLRLSLQEDSAFRDVTTRFLPRLNSSKSKATFLAKQTGVFCGGFLIARTFRILDPHVKVKLLIKDGQRVNKGDVLAVATARTAAVLGCERVILNLLTHLSGIATQTQRFCRALNNLSISVLDTRKTTPLWRDMEKYAVKCGGGINHRFSLEDAILVKDNHHAHLCKFNDRLSRAYSIEKLKAVRKSLKFVAVEATNYKQVWDAIKIRADIILLDNMPKNQIKGAMVFIKAARKALNIATPLVEVSGGVSLKNIRQYAKMGIDRISIGALTHSAPALDISLEVM